MQSNSSFQETCFKPRCSRRDGDLAPICRALEALEARRLLAAEVVALSEMEPVFARNGMGPFERDMSVGGRSTGDGNTLSVGGVTYTSGIGVAALSDIRYDLNGNFTRFQAVIGIDDEVGDAGMVRFQVFADGVKIYQSAKVTGASEPIELDFDMTDVDVLRLVVHNAGRGIRTDHADWADARLTGIDSTLNTEVNVEDVVIGTATEQTLIDEVL